MVEQRICGCAWRILRTARVGYAMYIITCKQVPEEARPQGFTCNAGTAHHSGQRACGGDHGPKYRVMEQ